MEQHSKVKDLDRICNNIMSHLGSKNNNNSIKQDKEHIIGGGGGGGGVGQRRSNSFEDHMLVFMGEKKRLLNIHEQKFAELAAF